MYDYRARLLEVHDGDTVLLHCDLGQYIARTAWYRLHGIQAPELSDEGGQEARLHLEGLLATHRDALTILTVKKAWYKFGDERTEKYGRFMVEVRLPDGTDVNGQMVADGHAVSWDGRGPRPSGLSG
jgi:endonuclease YncB( thermonuclease family)